MIKITPLGNQVLVQPILRKERTANGLIIPASINNELEEGIVIATATDIVNVIPGDVVLYSSRAGIPLLYEEINYKFLNGPTDKDPGEIKAII